MAGEAQSLSFIQGPATVMVGAVGELWDLVPNTHSLGLVKNVQVSTSRAYSELSQNGRLVYSVRTSETISTSFDVYEHTPRNLELVSGGMAGIDEDSNSYVDLGTFEEPFYAVKIVGQMPHQQTPVGVLFPKVRITSGMGLQFSDDKFSAMPWQIKPHPLLPSDPFYYQFKPGTVARLFVQKVGDFNTPPPGTRMLTLRNGRTVMARPGRQIRI